MPPDVWMPRIIFLLHGIKPAAQSFPRPRFESRPAASEPKHKMFKRCGITEDSIHQHAKGTLLVHGICFLEQERAQFGHAK